MQRAMENLKRKRSDSEDEAEGDCTNAKKLPSGITQECPFYKEFTQAPSILSKARALVGCRHVACLERAIEICGVDELMSHDPLVILTSLSDGATPEFFAAIMRAAQKADATMRFTDLLVFAMGSRFTMGDTDADLWKYLLRQCDLSVTSVAPCVRNEHIKLILHRLILKEDNELMELFVNAVNLSQEMRTKAVIEVAKRGDVQMARAINLSKYTRLEVHDTVSSRVTLLADAVGMGGVEFIGLLQAAQFPVDEYITDGEKGVALFAIAVQYGDLESVKYIREHGLDVAKLYPFSNWIHMCFPCPHKRVYAACGKHWKVYEDFAASVSKGRGEVYDYLVTEMGIPLDVYCTRECFMDAREWDIHSRCPHV